MAAASDVPYADRILPLDRAHLGSSARPQSRESIDKQIAATALIHDLEVISRNVAHYAPTGGLSVAVLATDSPRHIDALDAVHG
jgi:predicted nucleic acid-binding protein